MASGDIIVTFTVEGAPVAKGRPRMVGGKFPRAYTPAKTRVYENLIRLEAAAAMEGRDPIEGAILLSVTAYMPMPASFSKKKRQDAIDGLVVPAVRPDIDNIGKAAMDACNGILFRDDGQVCDLILRKRYSATPRLSVTMETL